MTRPRPDRPRHAAPLAAVLLLLAAAPRAAPAAEPPAEPTGAGAPGRTEPAEAAPPAPTSPEVKRIIYLPESARAQLRAELRSEMLEQARLEGWAAPGVVPDWVRRLKVKGDVRTRMERTLFSGGNGASGEFPDFAAINANKPFDLAGVDLANDRYLNVDRDRTRTRLRARLALDVDCWSGVTAHLRLAGGDGSSPVSTNQTLGGFTKQDVWIDRASIRIDGITPAGGGVALEVGHFENPFLRTDLVWDEDVNLDGAALRAELPTGLGLRPFLVAGAFPVFTTAFAFPSERAAKFKSLDKWLLAGQLGTGWRPAPGVRLQLGAAYYHYLNVEGRLSGPCDTHLKDVSCDTDHSRPAFAQKGNTYQVLRSPSAAALAAEAAGLVPRYQYFGLATPFRVLAVTARAELDVGAGLRATAEGEFARNLAFSRSAVEGRALNNRGAQTCVELSCTDRFAGGDRGYQGRIALGSARQAERGDWNAALTYRYLESDAVVDAFTDSDFGAGGTNLEGYGASAAVAIGHGTWIGARWLSADAIVGAPYRADVLQVDLWTRF